MGEEIRRGGYVIKKDEQTDVMTIQDWSAAELLKFKQEMVNKYKSLDCKYSALEARIKGILEYLRRRDNVAMKDNVVDEIPKEENIVNKISKEEGEQN